MVNINPDLCHDTLTKEMKQKLAFDPNVSLVEQRKVNKAKLFELLGMDKIQKNACPQNVIIESEELKDGYRLIRFVYESEKNMFVPAYLLIPTTGKKSYPVAIVLQGHKLGGMYSSIGIVKDEDDEEYQPRGAFALQAVENGFAALCIDLRGNSGELEPLAKRRIKGYCKATAFTAMMLGRTSLGEKCWDISRAIDLFPRFPELDANTIVITGNSGGGTTSFYAACCDERITLSAPSSSFCTYKDSILNVYHCVCNYVPRMYEWFEMHDLATLIAPRKLVLVNGVLDETFPVYGAEKGYETIRRIYQLAGHEDFCKLIVTPKGHYWCEDIVWPAILEMLNKQ